MGTIPLPLVQQTPSAKGPQRWRVGPFEGLPGEIDRHMLDLGFKAIYDHSYALEQTAVQAPTLGSKMASGALSVVGSVKAVVTGLATLSNVTVSIDAGATPTNRWVTATPSTTVPGAFDVYCWKPTAAGDNTPIAETAAVTVRWHALGT
jgi:hypothetical protein